MFTKRLITRLVFTSIVLISLFFNSLGTTPVYAASLTVNTNADTIANDGFCTLREAITNANNNSALYPTAGECAVGFGTDTITFATNYTITLAGDQLPAVTSTIIINGNGAANTIIQANASPNTATYRVFSVNNGDLTLNSLTVRHGDCFGGCFGGGISNNGGILTITNSTISGNSAGVSGGGVYNTGNLTITNSTISGNNTGNAGGGIYNTYYLTITNSTISGNRATYGGGIQHNTGTLTMTNSILSGNSATNGEGGGINNRSTLNISDSTFSTNTANHGGAIYNYEGNMTMTDSTLSENSANQSGGGIFTYRNTLAVTSSTFSGNSANENGGGISSSYGTWTVTDSTFSGNSANQSGGGLFTYRGALTVTDSSFSGNRAGNGGGIYTDIVTGAITDSTFSGNNASLYGGGIYQQAEGTLNVITSTFSGNSANNGGGIYNSSLSDMGIYTSTLSGNNAAIGGGIYNDGNLWLGNATLSGNEAYDYGGGIYSDGSAWIHNSTIAFNTLVEGTNLGAAGVDGNVAFYNTLVAGNIRLLTSEYRDCSGTIHSEGRNIFWNTTNCTINVAFGTWDLLNSLSLLGPLQNNGGPTWTHALLPGSNAIDTGYNTLCASWPINNLDQRGVARPQGSYCDVGAYEAGGIKVIIGNAELSAHALAPTQSTRVSLPGVNNGPVQLINRNGQPLIAAERLIYKVNGVPTSFSEMMGLPNILLDMSYWFPWYNNVDLDTQLRFGNVSGSTATVRIYIGGTEMTSGCTSTPSLPYPYVLANGASIRVSCAGVNNGPVNIQSTGKIVAAERLIYKVNGVPTSFTEMMGLPEGLLSTSYWLPWYNNVDLDTQLRFGNVGGSTATVRIFIGGVEMTTGCTSTPSLPYPYVLANGASIRVSCAGVNNGPVKIQSTGYIVAAERLIYKVNGVPTSFSEMMGLPNNFLDTSYWLPWYNNVDLDTQLRFGNVSGSTATVRVYIGGTEMTSGCTSTPSLPYPYVLANGASIRVSCAGVNNGPVKIVSNQNLVAAERVIYKVNGVNTSFSEMMGLPNNFLDTTYWLPWYNNVDLDTQLRFGVP